MENQIKQLFINFIRNTGPVEETETVLKLMREGGYEAEWLAAMEETKGTENVSELLHSFDGQSLFEQISGRIKKRKKRSSTWRWLSAAATLALVSSVAWILMQQSNTQPKSELPLAVVPKAVSGNRQWIKLPDGSSVQLNKNSRLEYPDTFNGLDTREVTLVGEAYFDVKHDVKHPFIIHTGKLKTTVLGTAFNISAFQADQSVTVTVTRGKVMVQDAQKTLAVLWPDQQLHWDRKYAETIKKQVNAEVVVAWKAQDLIMDDITLAEAANMLAKRYNLKVNFKTERVKNCRFTAAFLNRNSIEQVIRVLSDVSGAKLELKDQVLSIDGPGCGSE